MDPAHGSFRAIVDRAPDVIALIDAEGLVNYVNDHAERILGHPKSSVEGRSIFDFIHPEDTSRAAQEYNHTTQEPGERIPLVLRLRDLWGNWVPFEISANNQLKDAAVRAVIFVARDLRFRDQVQEVILRLNDDNKQAAEERVTALARTNAELRIEVQARRQAESRLENTISLLNATLDSTADGILVISKDGKVSSCNRKFIEMWGLRCESSLDNTNDQSLLTKVANQLIAPDEFLEKVNSLYADAAATSFDVLHFKDQRIFERYSQPQQLGDSIVGRVWSFRDVTKARQIELELRQAQKMEALGRLAGGIAHDFNNLLMLVSGYTMQLLEHPPLSEADGICQQILSITKRAASVTRQLLAFSRKLPEELVTVDLNTVLLAIERLLRQLLSDQIQIQISGWKEVLPVYVDTSQIELMIINLVMNAQDAMPNGGDLSLHLHAEAVGDEAKRRRYAVLTISDTGQGIAPDVLAHIFEPFYTTKGPERGTGLGLSTVWGIVERLAGWITVDSKPNLGTTFRVYLPLVTGQLIADSSGTSVETVPVGSETILLAEDEAGIRTMTRTYLEGLGYRVIEARDGTDAIGKSHDYYGAIDLVITDILMPGMRGDAAIRLIRRDRPEILAVYMSGYYPPDDLREGPDVVLHKPFEFPELGRRIRSLLDAKLLLRKNRRRA